uniref:ras association domain-containing protein 1-like n=1 Tax=Myxine glutinosa TaxID=7769 RepID=UPI003590123F
MSWSSTLSSGYSSLDEDSELEQFYTARTSFLWKPRRKPHDKDAKPARVECQTLTWEEIEQMIKVYNSQVNNKFGMELLPDGGFTGFIKVQMHLQRPVSVAGTVGTAVSSPSLNDTGQRTTFYLPRGTEKQVHLSNSNMAREVISALLHKFHVLDNPRKFALFQCSGPASCMTKRKLEDEENPLHLRLLAGPDMAATRFVLQENETGEVIWDAFTIPELHNFLLILEREEESYVQKVQEKYSSFQEKLHEALAARKPG